MSTNQEMNVETKQLAKIVARTVAREMFVNGNGQRAERLVLTLDGPPKRDLGGWGLQPFTDRVEEVVFAALSKASPQSKE